MQQLAERLHHIEALRQKIEAFGKIPDEVLGKIEYKFRLECNYHSNRIEGGTLSKRETRSVMIDNISVVDKPLKDIREMKGHDEAMLQILKIGKGELRLSEKRIQEIHRMIIVAKNAEESAEIGRWKQDNNQIINYNSEVFNFTDYSEVRDVMHKLMNWANSGLDKIVKKNKNAPQPLLLCFEFHQRYLTIHPFSDGNGRSARLILNLMLVSLGYPPIWVSEGSEKDAYNRYLGDIQGYKGSPDLFYEFLAGLMERSLRIVLDALEGKDIDDADDWMKKLNQLKTTLPEEDALRVVLSKEVAIAVYEQSMRPTIALLMDKLKAFDDLFLKKELSLGGNRISANVDSLEQIDFNARMNLLVQDPSTFSFSYFLGAYKKENGNPFYIRCRIIWRLENYHYTLTYGDNEEIELFSKQYDVFYSEEELKEILRRCGEFMLQQIEEKRTKV